MKDELAAKALLKDPRIAQAKKMILDSIQDHQKDLKGVRPANPALKQSYANLITTFNEYRGGKLYYPYMGSGFGKGALVELLDGSIKYDLICGIGPHYFGHSDPRIINASLDAAISDTVMQGHLQQNNDAMLLAETLLGAAKKMSHCFFTTSGAMANENALKIIFQKKFPASRILAFDHCFMGRSLALSQITDKPSYREGLPSNVFVDYVPFYDTEKPEESTVLAVKTLKQHLSRYPKEYALMCFEVVQGEGGFNVGSKEFFTTIMSILKENHIAILADEVQSFGRTPELFGYQYFGLDDFVDVVTIGKLSQTCATLYTKEFLPRPGLLSQTFTGSTSSLCVGRYIVQELLKGGYFGANGIINNVHQRFVKNFQEIEKTHPTLIHGPYGIGAMIAFTPFGGDAKRVMQYVQDLFEAGVIAFVAGSNPTRVRLLPPAGAITMDEIDAACEIIGKTLRK